MRLVRSDEPLLVTPRSGQHRSEGPPLLVGRSSATSRELICGRLARKVILAFTLVPSSSRSLRMRERAFPPSRAPTFAGARIYFHCRAWRHKVSLHSDIQIYFGSCAVDDARRSWSLAVLRSRNSRVESFAAATKTATTLTTVYINVFPVLVNEMSSVEKQPAEGST